MTDAEFLRAIGEALYGPQWQSALARDLDGAKEIALALEKDGYAPFVVEAGT